MRVRSKPTRADLLELWTLIYGAEDPVGDGGEATDDGQDPDSIDPATTDLVSDGNDDDDDDDQTVPMSEVRKLRREAAKYRVQAKEALDKLSEKEKAELSEIDRAKVEADEAKQRAELLESELKRERFRNALIAEASSQKFTDPSDVIALISQEDIATEDDGTPKRSSLKAAVERIAKNKPYLLATSNPGSGDGGSRGGNPDTNDTARKYEQTIQSRGGVKIPG